MSTGAKILMLDIETAPAKVFAWGLYDQNIPINHVIETGHVICWCAKWLGSKEIMSGSYYKKSATVYRQMLTDIWNLLDEADIVVTHNGNFFDLRWLNMVFLENNFKPVSTFKSIDTKTEMQRAFYALSNKLDFICQKLELGHKGSTGGFELWIECMKFNKVFLNKMVSYCKQDVILLEKLYLKIRPFIKNHPNLNLYSNEASSCPNCNCTVLQRKGFAYTSSNVYQRFRCTGCGKNVRGKKSVLGSKLSPV